MLYENKPHTVHISSISSNTVLLWWVFRMPLTKILNMTKKMELCSSLVKLCCLPSFLFTSNFLVGPNYYIVKSMTIICSLQVTANIFKQLFFFPLRAFLKLLVVYYRPPMRCISTSPYYILFNNSTRKGSLLFIWSLPRPPIALHFHVQAYKLNILFLVDLIEERISKHWLTMSRHDDDIDRVQYI